MIRIRDERLEVFTTYEERDLAKSIPGYRWNADKKVWTYPLTPDTLKLVARTFHDKPVDSSVNDYIRTLKEIKVNHDIEDADIPYEKADQLYNYQRAGVHFLISTNRALLADQMGLGKTIQLLAVAECLGSEKVLVVCPNTVKENWNREIDRWAPGSSVETNGKHTMLLDARFTIMNYEALRLERNATIYDVDWDIVILDEAHKIKNRKAIQTKQAKKLTAERKYCLTGTPIMNHPYEIWSLLNFLDKKAYSSFWSFVRRWCEVIDGFWGIEIGPCKDVDNLRSELSFIMLRREKSQVLTDLPPKTFEERYVELDPEQLKAYEAMRDEMVAQIEEVDKEITAPAVIAMITRLRQIVISPQIMLPDSSSYVVDKYPPKIRAVLDAMEECDNKIVVFSQFNRALKLLAKCLDKEGIGYVMLTGETPQKKRQTVIDMFSEETGPRVMLANMLAGGLGINLTAANTCILLDHHWTPATMEQAVDRLHRIGQDDNVTVVSIIAKDTIEDYIQRMLRNKAQSFWEIISVWDALDLLSEREVVE